jgi:uncharacterized delta-60 repeat protein
MNPIARQILLCLAVSAALVSPTGAAPGDMDPMFSVGAGADGTVKGAAELADGSVVIVGAFYSVDGVARRGLAKFGVNGAVDAAWLPPSSASFPDCVVAVADGKVLVGGASYGAGAARRIGIARLNADGSIDATFDAGTAINSSVRDIVVQADGLILVGGDFTGGIARLRTDGTADPTFTPGTGPDGAVSAIAVVEEGKILIGGDFSRVAGIERRYLAQLEADGTLDESYGGTDWGPSSPVKALAKETAGDVLVGGSFSSFSGLSRARLVRVDRTGQLDGDFAPGISSTVERIVYRSDGRILVGGSFTSAGGGAANRLALLRAEGRLDGGFPTANGPTSTVETILPTGGGGVLIGGSFTATNGAAVGRVARLLGTGPSAVPAVGSLGMAYGEVGSVFKLRGSNFDQLTAVTFSGGAGASFRVIQPSTVEVTVPAGAKAGPITVSSGSGSSAGADWFYPIPGLAGEIDPRFAVGSGANSTVFDFERDVSGMVVVGDFTSVNGVSVNRIAKIGADGRVDEAFAPVGEFLALRVVARQGNLGYLVGGATVAGRQGLARIGFDGVVDAAFDASATLDGNVSALAVQPDGKVIVGGTFTRKLVRLNADGSFDPSYLVGSGASGSVNAIERLDDGRVLVGGSFSLFNGRSSRSVIRLDVDGTLDAGFAPTAPNGSTVFALGVEADGSVLVGGNFSASAAAPARLLRLRADGSLDASFQPGVSDDVNEIEVSADGRILIGGEFLAVGSAARNYLAVLRADGSADPSFETVNRLSGEVEALLLQAPDRIFVGGRFETVSGRLPARLAALNLDHGETAPAVGSFAPQAVWPGAVVTLTGSNLAGLSSVRIGGVSVPSGSIDRIGETRAEVTVPVGALTGSIEVGNAFGQTATTAFLRVGEATTVVVSGLPAGTVMAGSTITVTGSGFEDVTSVRIGLVLATFTLQSATSMSVVLPSNTVSGKVRMTGPGGSVESAQVLDVRPRKPEFRSQSTGADGAGQARPPDGWADVVELATGASHRLAVALGGRLTACGRNYDGQATVPPSLGLVVAAGCGRGRIPTLRRRRSPRRRQSRARRRRSRRGQRCQS